MPQLLFVHNFYMTRKYLEPRWAFNTRLQQIFPPMTGSGTKYWFGNLLLSCLEIRLSICWHEKYLYLISNNMALWVNFQDNFTPQWQYFTAPQVVLIMWMGKTWLEVNSSGAIEAVSSWVMMDSSANKASFSRSWELSVYVITTRTYIMGENWYCK